MKERDERRKIFQWTAVPQSATAPRTWRGFVPGELPGVLTVWLALPELSSQEAGVLAAAGGGEARGGGRPQPAGQGEETRRPAGPGRTQRPPGS